MPCPVVATIKILRVNPIDVSHALGKVAINRFHHQVVVVLHKAIGVAEPVEPFEHLLEDNEKPLPVVVVLEYRQAGISPGRDVIDCARKFEAKWSSHDA
jgi:hypothetical protein